MKIEVTLCDVCREEINDYWRTSLQLAEQDAPDDEQRWTDFCSLACLRNFVTTLTTA